MKKEEFQTERTRILSDMLDNPDKYGIYPTTICFNELDKLYERIVEEAIAESEAAKWKPYPDEKPEKSGIYYCLIQYQEDKMDENGEKYQLEWQTYEMVRYYFEYGEFYHCVIAWQELPAAYQPD